MQLGVGALRRLEVRLPRIELFVGADDEVDAAGHIGALDVVPREDAAENLVLAVEQGVDESGLLGDPEDRFAEAADIW